MKHLFLEKLTLFTGGNAYLAVQHITIVHRYLSVLRSYTCTLVTVLFTHYVSGTALHSIV